MLHSTQRIRFIGLILGLGICRVGAASATTFNLPPAGTDIVGHVRTVISKSQDTLLDIARRHDLGYNEIIEANPGVDPWLPGNGSRVVLPTQFILPDAPRQGIVLNVAAMRLYYYPVPKAGEKPKVITYPVGIGRMRWETPLGVTRITIKIVDPSWHVPTSIRKEHAKDGDALPGMVAPGPDNPLGHYAMLLGIHGYLIHGTDKPYGVGRRVSHGCVRLYPEDIVRLFRQVPIGTPVHIVDQPYLAGWLHGELYLEAHRPLAEDRNAWKGSLTPMVQAIMDRTKHAAPSIDWAKAMHVARQVRSLPITIGTGHSNKLQASFQVH